MGSIISLNFMKIMLHMLKISYKLWLPWIISSFYNSCYFIIRSRRGCDSIVVGFTTTCAISYFQHSSCEFEPHSWGGTLDTTLCDKVCQWLATGRWLSPGTVVSSTNKTDCHDIAEILTNQPNLLSKSIVGYARPVKNYWSSF